MTSVIYRPPPPACTSVSLITVPTSYAMCLSLLPLTLVARDIRSPLLQIESSTIILRHMGLPRSTAEEKGKSSGWLFREHVGQTGFSPTDIVLCWL